MRIFALAGILTVFWLALVMRLLLPYLRVRLDNLRAAMMRLQPHLFLSDQRARDLYLIMAVNWLMTVLTLGVFRPFAVVRLWRYRVEHFAVVAAGSSDEFVAGAGAGAPVLGSEAADLLDVDFGF